MLLFYKFSVSQNLVQNGSFESYNTPVNWNNWGGGFFDTSVFPFQRILNNWEQYNSPDCFLSACTHTYSGAPINRFGYCQAKDGTNYVGIGVYIKGGGNQEYISEQLITPLQAGVNYCLSFFVSRADRIPYAIKTIGAYFSVSPPTMVSSSYINVIPQIESQNTFLTDTTQWIQIHDCFVAQGGEQYITIGNFNNELNTDTLRIQSSNPLTGNGYDVSYYYIDDVNLVEDLSTGTNETGNDMAKIRLFPNPNNGIMQIEYDLGKDAKATMKLFDVTGAEIKSYPLENNNGRLQIEERTLHNGIYFYRILVGGKVIKSDKIVIIK